MNHTKTLLVLAGLGVSAIVATACGGGGTGGSGGATSSASGSTSAATMTTSSTTVVGSTTAVGSTGSSSSTGTKFPAPPTLGAQIDRMGRPAINTALNHTFDTAAVKGPAKDAYNQDTMEATWPTTYAPQFAVNLAILDGLDTNCGNQLEAAQGAGQPMAGRYNTLAGQLADDALWVKTDETTCGYLGVEAHILAGTPASCGGRVLKDDVIDLSYSLLAAGAFSGVTDGVAADADTQGTTFPYLAAPH